MRMCEGAPRTLSEHKTPGEDGDDETAAGGCVVVSGRRDEIPPNQG